MSAATIDTVPDHTRTAPARLDGILAIVPAVMMLIGAGLWVASGIDIDAAVGDGDMAGYLTGAAANRGLIVANQALWLAAMPVFAAALTRVAARTRSPLGEVGRSVGLFAAVLAGSAFVALLTVTAHVAAPAPTETAVAVADALGFYGSRADWVGTIGLVGVAPLLLGTAGRDDWAPTWLVRWSWLAGACAVLTAVALFTDGLGTYGFLIVPVGLVWWIGTGAALLDDGS